MEDDQVDFNTRRSHAEIGRGEMPGFAVPAVFPERGSSRNHRDDQEGLRSAAALRWAVLQYNPFSPRTASLAGRWTPQWTHMPMASGEEA
jgi:hypothetical protein